MPPGLRGLFITGTDTGVGKTLVATALLRLARRRGLTPVPYKPVETGCDPVPLDAAALARASGWTGSLSEVCPHALRLPAAPAAAAAAEGINLNVAALAARARVLAATGDLLIVEGAGGLLVPYAAGQTGADLARAIGLPLLVVGRTALGTINHSALTIREARHSDLKVAGLILNKTTPDPEPHAASNAHLIAELTGIHPIATLPYLSPVDRADPDSTADALAAAISPSALQSLLTGEAHPGPTQSG